MAFKLCNSNHFNRANPAFLEEKYRLKRFEKGNYKYLILEFEHLHSDIICLEEVDKFEEFKSILEKLN